MRRRLAGAALAAAVLACVLSGPLLAGAGHVVAVIQKGRAFSAAEIAIDRGDTIRFSNEDPFLHQIFVHSDKLTVDSDEQRPGQDVDVRFPTAGRFQVLCTIHPKMALSVEVR